MVEATCDDFAVNITLNQFVIWVNAQNVGFFGFEMGFEVLDKKIEELGVFVVD